MIVIPLHIDTLIFTLIYGELSKIDTKRLEEWITEDRAHMRAFVARGKAYWKMKRLFNAEN